MDGEQEVWLLSILHLIFSSIFASMLFLFLFLFYFIFSLGRGNIGSSRRCKEWDIVYIHTYLTSSSAFGFGSLWMVETGERMEGTTDPRQIDTGRHFLLLLLLLLLPCLCFFSIYALPRVNLPKPPCVGVCVCDRDDWRGEPEPGKVRKEGGGGGQRGITGSGIPGKTD